MTEDPFCDCGQVNQTIHHIINDCPRRYFHGSKRELYNASEIAKDLLSKLDISI